MNEQITLRIFEIVGSELCVASDDGQKVHDEIAAALKAGHAVQLSFANVETVTSAFLNAAIGQLYSSFPPEEVKERLSVTDMEPDDVLLLKRVVETAKEYFSDPQRFEIARREALGEEDEE